LDICFPLVTPDANERHSTKGPSVKPQMVGAILWLGFLFYEDTKQNKQKHARTHTRTSLISYILSIPLISM